MNSPLALHAYSNKVVQKHAQNHKILGQEVQAYS